MVAQIESRKYHVTVDDIARHNLNPKANLARIKESISALIKVVVH